MRLPWKDDLIGTIWDGRVVSDAALTTRVNVARCVIGYSGEEQRLIKTLPKKGFRFVGVVQEIQSALSVAVTISTRNSRNLPSHFQISPR